MIARGHKFLHRTVLPLMKTYLTYGIYNTLAFALLNLVLYFTGFQTEKLAIGQYLNYIGTAISSA